MLNVLEQCTKSKNYQKVVTPHVWEEHKEKVRLNRLSKTGKLLYNYRKVKVERSFADSKALHGVQALLTAVVQNIKKIAMHLARTA